jgi:photosystem II stability/assembly factor-like uncharacterized protein
MKSKKNIAFLSIFILITPVFQEDGICQWNYTGLTLPGPKPTDEALTGAFFGKIHYKDAVTWLCYKDKIFLSQDTGKSWKQLSLPFTFQSYEQISDMTSYDNNQAIICFNYHPNIVTFDRGTSWSILPPGYTAGSNSVAYLGNDSVIIGAHNRGICLTSDRGVNSSLVYYRQGTTVGNFIQIYYSQKGNIFALLSDNDTLGYIAISSDGGISWKKTTTFDNDTWSFEIDPCDDSILYVANEDKAIPQNFLSELYRSTNQGTTWDTTYRDRYRFVSGSIVATPKAVYAGTMKDGVLRSTDKGKTWISIGGPPLGFDTRLLCAVNDNIVFVVDTNAQVWVTYNSGGDPIQQGEVPTLTKPVFTKTSTCSLDTGYVTIRATGCGVMTIDSISIIGQDAKHFIVSTPTFPSFLTEGTSNSWGIQFSPLDQVGLFTTTLHIKGHYKLYNDSLGIDTIITISAESLAEPPRLTTLSTSYNLGTASTCNQARDTVITLRNTGCDTLCITQGPGVIASEYSISSLLYPYCLPPDSSVTINVRFTPSGTGTFRAYPKYRAEQQGLTQDVELFLEGTGVEKGGELAYEPRSFTFPLTSICSQDSAFGFITNIGCDTLILESTSLTGDIDFTSTTIGSNILVAPGDTLRYRILFSPSIKGNRSAALELSSKNNLPSRRDTIPITATVTDGTRILSSSPNTLNFGTTTLCEERDSVVTLRNTGCDTLRVSGVGVQSIGFSSNVTTPIIILPGGSVDIPINTIVDTSQGSISTGTITFTSDADNKISPITLSRGYTYPKSYSFHIAMLNATATSDEIVRLAIVGEQGLGSAGSGVNRLDFDLSLNEDLLEYIRPEGSNTVSKNGSRISISNPNELTSIDDTLAIFVYHVFLTKDSETDITVSNISINNGDTSSCAPKIASATQAGFTYRYECGDRQIQSFLRTGQASLEITSIRPNPAKDELTVEFLQNEKSTVSFEVYDMLGTLMLKKEELYDQGRKNKTIELRDLPSGSYVISLRSASGVTSKRFTKEK